MGSGFLQATASTDFHPLWLDNRYIYRQAFLRFIATATCAETRKPYYSTSAVQTS